MRKILFILAVWLPALLCAQQYLGMSGLVHVPSAEMNRAGDARIGVHFLNKEFSPANMNYHTGTHYLSITPFSWIELAYTCTLLKGHKWNDESGKMGYYHKDRYFSVKVRPLKEGKWHPALAVGTNDPYSHQGDDSHAAIDGTGNNSRYFGNFYVTATKHLLFKEHELGVHLVYRKFKRDFNAKWNGVAGGITYRPSFARNLRAIAEYTGDDINIGMDCLLWKHLLLQASLQDGKYFSGGVCFQMNLF